MVLGENEREKAVAYPLIQEGHSALADVTPDPILDIGNGFRAAKLMFAASELGLFERLAGGPTALDNLAAGMAIAPSRLLVVLDALIVLGLIERHGDTYQDSPVAATYLSGQTASDLRPALRFWDKLCFPLWTDLAGVLRSGRSPGRRTDEEQRIFSDGVEALTASAAQALAAKYDFSQHRRVLDLGGGTGSWLVAIKRRHDHLGATLFEQPPIAAIARQRLAADLAGREIEVVEGDFFQDPIPSGHDAILMANVLHGGPADLSIALLRRVRAAASDGARLLLSDGWADATRTRPPFGAIYAIEYLVHGSNAGRASEDEVQEWLRESGWRLVEARPLAGPQSVIVAEAIVLPR